MDKKALSLPLLTSLQIGNMLGTGIYILPAALAVYGALSLFSWVYVSFGALLIALVFCSLSKRYPETGGPYVYCREAFGKFIGFLIACTYWFTNLASIAGVIVASVGYLGYLLPVLDANTASYHPYVALGFELGLLWLFTLINIIGIHEAGVVQFILTVLKIAPLLIISALGIGYMQGSNLAIPHVAGFTSLGAIGKAATIIFWAFIGIEAASVPAENTEGHSIIYKATIYGTLITALIYILTSTIIMGMIPSTSLANSQFPFAEAGRMIFGTYGAAIVVICAFVSGVGTLNACILLQAQVVFAAARDKFLPKTFAKLSKKDVPVAGQLLGSAIVSLGLILSINPSMLKQFDLIALVASMLALITYFVTMLAEIKFLLKSRVKHLRKYLNIGMLIAVLATIYTAWMVSSFDKEVIMITCGIIVGCVVLYFTLARRWARG